MTTTTETLNVVKTTINDNNWSGVPGFLVYQGEVVEKNLMEGNILTAMDVSGSTEAEITMNYNDSFNYMLARNKKTILDVEKYVLTKFNAECLAWSHILNGIYPKANDDRITSQGGTAPASIFTSEDSNNKIMHADVFVMSTDGQVDQNQVQIFSEYVNRFSNVKMFIGVIVGNKQIPSQINISVFAAKMNSDCIIVHTNNTDGHLKILYTNGVPSTAYPNPMIKDLSYDQLPNIHINELTKLKIRKMTSEIPDGYISLSDRQYINLKLLFEQKEISQDVLMTINYQSLLMLCKTQNKLKEFRQWFNLYKPAVIAEFNSPIEGQIAHKLSIIRRLMIHILDQSVKVEMKKDIEDELVRVRKELAELRVTLEKERQDYNKLVNQISQSYRRFHEMIMMDLHNIEKATYDLGDVRSNRAARAERVQETMTIDDIIIDESTYRGEDSITLEENKIMALILREPEYMTLNTSDFALSWPFAVYNQEMASPDYVSLDIAKYLAKQMNDLTRNKIMVYLPVLDLKYNENRQYVKQQICKAFLSGRDMSHSWRLFFSFLYNCYQKEWSEGPMRQMIHWYMDQVLTHHKTTETFTEEGAGTNAMVPLRKAISSFLGNVLVQSHPINSVLMMVNVALMYKLDGIPMDGYKKVVREKYMRYVCEMILSVMKKIARVELLYYYIKRMFYNYGTGVSIINSGHTIKYRDMMNLMKKLKIDTTYVEQNILFYQRLTGQMDIDMILEPEMISVCLGMFLEASVDESVNFQQYRSESLFDYFKTNKVFLGVLHQDKVDVKSFINRIFAKYHMRNDMGKGFKLPLYATVYGPSVLTGLNGDLFIGNNERDQTYKWSEFDNILRESRRVYFRKIYGCENTTPTKYSSNFNLHSTVASILETEADIQLNRVTLLRILKQIIKCNGNIYIPELLEDILRTMYSYKQIRLMQTERLMDVNLVERAKLELKIRNIPYDTTGILIPKNFDNLYPLPQQNENIEEYIEVITPLTDKEIDDLYV